ncbi:MAG: hypothetical protein MJ162_00560 [Treponema sp.]|nr:hypothetical protein [Treponema sp.]
MKKNRIFNALVLAASLVLLNTSCEIGLGSSVDVQAPTLSISYPEQASVIREDFIIAGECDDDKGIEQVKITIQRTDTGKAQTVTKLNAEVDPVTGKWQASVNKFIGEGKGYNGWELADGKYVANVTAVDNSGRDSGVASLTFDIDNTAPIFIIKSPTSRKITSPTGYGTSFKVTGTMTDDHTVSKMIIKVYDDKADFSDPDNPPVPLDTIYESNIDTTTEVVVANRNREGYLKDRYEAFYAGTNEGENRALWCTVEMEDNARIYRNPDEDDNESIGNTTSNFYIVDEVNSTWSNSDKEMDPGKVKKIVNRTAAGIDQDLAAEVMRLFNESYVTKAAFSINSDSNPTYEIRNYGNAADTAITKAAGAEGNVSFSLAPGRNGDNVCPATVKVFLWGPCEAPASLEQIKKMYSSDLSEIEAFAKTNEIKNQVLAYMGPGEYELNGTKYTYHKEDGTEDLNGAGGSVPTFDFELTLPESITTGKYYYISAHGLDLTDAIANPSYKVFAFKGHSTGNPPILKWENTAYGTNSVEDDGIIGAKSVTYSGYATYPDGLEDFEAITYRVNIKEVDFSTNKEFDAPSIAETTIPEANLIKDSEHNIVYWTFTLPGLAENSDKLQFYDVNVKAKGIGETQSNLTRRLTIDTKKPRLEIKSITPVVSEGDSKYLNGTSSFEVDIQDKNLNKVWYEVYSGDSETPVLKSKDYGEDTFNLSAEIDTTAAEFSSANNKPVNIKIWAEDKAGNKNFTDSTTQNGEKSYILKQDSDKPTIQTTSAYDAANTAKDKLSAGAWYDKGSSISFSITDDDGIASVSVKEGSKAYVPLDVSSGTQNATVNYALPKTDGVYQITLKAVDSTYEAASAGAKAYRETIWGPYTVGVDTAAPTLKDDKAYSNNYATDNFKVSGTLSDANGIASIDVVVKKEGSDATVKSYSLGNGVTYNATSKVWEASIAKGSLTDGKYTFTTTAKDYAGNMSIAESVWTVDTVKPVVKTAEITTAHNSISATSYSKENLDIKVSVEDATSGISDVLYSLDGTNWISLVSGSTYWTATVNCDQGSNSIKIKAVDEAGIESSVTTLPATVDTVAPETISLVSVDGDTSFSGIKMVNSSASVKFVVNAVDSGSGVKSVAVSKIGTVSKSISGTLKDGKYEITIPSAQLDSGLVYVKVTDKADNVSNEISLFTIDYDKILPVVEIKSVTPVATRKNDATKYLNGQVTISGRVSETNLVKKWYEVWSNGSKVITSTPEENSEPGFNFEIDTTDSRIAQKKNFYVKVFAEDKAGNINDESKTETYVVDQDTDRPQIEANNFDFILAEGHSKQDITSWFAAGEKLLGTVSDDDTIASVSIGTKKENDTVVKAAANQDIPANSLTANISYELPSADGVYKVTIIANDSTYASAPAAYKNYRTNTMGPFLVGVDTAAPEVTEAHSTGTNIVRSNITLNGTASDGNGIKEIVVKVLNTKTSEEVKTYKLSEGTVTLSGTNWSCATTLDDGLYTITTTATDYSGKSNTPVESVFVKDNVKPTVNTQAITTTGSTIGGKTWFTAGTSVDVSVTASDATSGIVNVQYSLDGNNWSDFKEVGSNWTASVKCEQGENTISIKAIDDSGLESEIKTLTANVDTSAPETLNLVSVDSVADFTGVKMVNGKVALPFVVEAADSGTGIASVKVTKIGATAVSIAAGTPTGNNYPLTIAAANLKTGAVEVTVTDKAGKSTSANLFSLTLDNVAPDVVVSSVTPVVSKDTGKYVNGNIKITAKINDTNLSNVWYVIKNGSNETKSADQGAINALEVTVDTTKYAKDSTLDVIVWAEDKAGNKNSANASSVNGTGEILFTVNQETDKPEVTPSNFTFYAYDSSKSEGDIPEDEWFNASGNNKVIASVSDDDVLKSVKIVTKNAAGTSVVTAEKELVTTGTTPSTVNVNYVLPSADGVYQITITAVDDTYAAGATTAIKENRMLTYGPFIVGVDTAKPSVTQDDSVGTNYKNGQFVISGTATDLNGIKDIEITAVKEGASTPTATYKLSAGSVTYTKATGKWSCTVPASLGEGKYKFTITAKDFSGKTETVENTYVKDSTAPAVTVDVTSSATEISSVKWYKSTTVAIEATASDSASGIATVEYSTDEGSTKTWIPLRQSTVNKAKWTANVTCSAQGANKIYVKATDEAGLEGNIANGYITVYVDSKEPEVCELYSIDGETDFNTKKLANGKAAINFVVTAKDSDDACTGLKTIANGGVAVTKIGTSDVNIKASAVADNKYTLSIPAANIENGAVVVTLTDQLNNSKEFTVFSIDKDTDAPVIEIEQLSDAEASTPAVDVNSTITFKGTANDTKDLAAVKLYYAVGTEPAVPSANEDKDSSWTGWTSLAYTGSRYAWNASLDTSKLTDKNNLYFYAVAVDTAGNTKVVPYSTTKQLYINQDSDRPRIILSNLALTSGTTGSYTSSIDTTDNKYWHKDNTLQGRVEDDDGSIQEVLWKDGSAGEWSRNIYRKGTWTINNLDDGAKEIYFKVIDALGTEFVSAATGLKGPKVIDSNGQECLGYTGKVNEVLNIKVDTNAPAVGTLYGYVSSSTTYEAAKAVTKITEIGTVGGDTDKYLFVQVTSSDSNGIGSVTLTLNGNAATKVNAATSADNTTYVGYFDLSTLTPTTGKKIENRPLKVVVEDKAGKSYEDTIDITVDNVKPTVKFDYANGVSLYGSESNTINGRTDDASEITKMWYAFTLTSTAPAAESAYKLVAYETPAEDEIARNNWSIMFDGGETTPTDFHTTGLNAKYKELTGTEDLSGLSNVEMYLWIRAEDSVGNRSEPVSLMINNVPNSSIPRVEITYPEGDKAVGGNLRVTGTAEVLTDSIDRVYMQIDPAYNGTAFNDAGWEAALQTIITNKKVTGYEIVSTGKTGKFAKGILVTGTTGWSQTINADREFEDEISAGVNRTIAIRVFAISRTNGDISPAVEKVVPIDPNSPLFGDITIDGYDGMQLIKYASGSSGTVTSRQPFKDGIYLKGNWYIKGSISDDSGIMEASVTFPDGTVTPIVQNGAVVNSTYASVIGTSKDGKGKNFYINVPVGDATPDEFGSLEYEVNIKDNSDSHSEANKVFKVNYDNKAPVFAVTTENKEEIYQSNGTYTLTGTVKEDSNGNKTQAGFERVVMFVTNERGTAPNTTLLVDPMISKGADSTSNRESVAALTQEDGLYWRTATIAGVTNGAMTVSKLNGATITEVTPKVRAGGLCKIDGVIYRIKYVNGKSVKLDDSIDTSATSVMFAAGAMVIDNMTTESGTKTSVYDPSKTGENGNDTVQTGGDGDQMMEKTSTKGSETTWSVSIDSSQIRDGSVDIHFVAFDKAGNTTEYSYESFVKNNAPRFAGVKFGADLMNDGSVNGSDWITAYADKYVQVTTTSGEVADGKDRFGNIISEISNIDEAYRLPVKSGFALIPQIVGGNDGLTWKMTYKDSAAATVTTAATDYGVGNSENVIRNYGDDSDADDYTSANDDTYKIEYTATQLLKLNSDKGIASGKQDLKFTFQDKTESGSLSASITLPVNVILGDNSAPEAYWKPLFWKSSSDNSLYNNSQSYGHIELAEDWANSTKKTENDYGTNDADSKVSGIITMEGYAVDNVLVNSITVNVDGTDYTLSRNGSGWTTTAGHLITHVDDDPETEDVIETTDYTTYDIATNNWYFEVVSDITDNRIFTDASETVANEKYGYNTVTFRFHWNTAKLLASNKKAKKDVQLTVKAADKGPTVLNAGKTAAVNGTAKSSTPGTAKTDKDTETDLYQLDVVPYITKVYTELAALQKREAKWSKTSRTSNGVYPVRFTTKNVDGTTVNNGETITFYGFNLVGAQYVSGTALAAGTKLSYVTAPYDCVNLPITDAIPTGPVKLLVDGVYTINNVNNNDAKGSYTAALTDANCGTYGYNRQPNNDNNKKLTDDVSLDVWQINSQAGKPVQGRIDQPVMSINQVTGWIGFGFADGPASFSMGGGNHENGRSWSYYQWLKSYDAFSSIAFTYDALGYSYGTAAGGDISSTTLDRYVLASSRGSSATLALANTYNGTNCERLERIGQGTMDNTNKQRFKSPSLATARHGTTRTNLYLAYYDSINNEIRLRYGSTTVTNGKINTDDFAEVDVDTSGAAAYNTTNKSLIAYGISPNANNRTTYTQDASGNDASPGEYLSIGVISAEGDATNNFDDKLVAVWYNQLTKALWYSYNATPTAARATNATNRGTWSTPVRVFNASSTMAAAGQYCKLAVDKNGGVHIAGYDPENQDLCYAYLAPGDVASATTAKFKTAVVDSKDVVGSNLSIDVGLKLVGTDYVPVPSIGYYSTESVKPVYAYLYDTSKLTSTTAGALNGTVKDMYTGVWECSLVPTTETPDLQSKLFNMINVGLWKTLPGSTKAGVITTPPTRPNQTNAPTTYNRGLIYGNNTANAVLGYVVKRGGANVLETAQKK